MSGIMAIVSLDGRPVPPALARAQLSAIAHRGEWEPRLWEAPGVALGHVNLPRTPEAEREILPASESTGRYWITWDGRLDNREELASLLRLDAEQARSMTDADYVLAAYRELGDDSVHKLLGDWAIVIWDSVERRLFCAKDPIGWRQLYYAESDGLLLVGSEPRQLLVGGWLPRIANEEHLLRFLAHAERESTETYYKGIFELQGGANLIVSAPLVETGQFWRAPEYSKRRYARPQAYVDEFQSRFETAVVRRLRSNRKIGLLLSGGLDSSYVAGVAAQRNADLTAYVIYVPGTSHLDEREQARYVAERTGIRLIEVDATDSWYLSRRWLPDSTFDQPRMPGAAASLRAVASVAAENGQGILLGGEGGDEWLDGGTWTGSRYRCLADALVHLRPITAWRLAGNAPTNHSRLAHFAAALIDDALPLAIAKALRRRMVHPVEPLLTPS